MTTILLWITISFGAATVASGVFFFFANRPTDLQKIAALDKEVKALDEAAEQVAAEPFKALEAKEELEERAAKYRESDEMKEHREELEARNHVAQEIWSTGRNPPRGGSALPKCKPFEHPQLDEPTSKDMGPLERAGRAVAERIADRDASICEGWEEADRLALTELYDKFLDSYHEARSKKYDYPTCFMESKSWKATEFWAQILEAAGWRTNVSQHGGLSYPPPPYGITFQLMMEQ